MGDRRTGGQTDQHAGTGTRARRNEVDNRKVEGQGTARVAWRPRLRAIGGGKVTKVNDDLLPDNGHGFYAWKLEQDDKNALALLYLMIALLGLVMLGAALLAVFG